MEAQSEQKHQDKAVGIPIEKFISKLVYLLE